MHLQPRMWGNGSWMWMTSLDPIYALLTVSYCCQTLSFALVLTFFEAAHFFQVNSTLGPPHLSLMMMLKDIIRFLALFALNVFAFALAMRKLYSQYVQTSSPVKELNNSTASHSFERYKACREHAHCLFLSKKPGQSTVLKKMTAAHLTTIPCESNMAHRKSHFLPYPSVKKIV